MKFPYGISDFKAINTEGYYYCDRTDKIPLLEKSKSQLFIRPRRFGKSLLLSMLENYYDVAKKDEFENIFGSLAIGKKPTKLRNSYYILKWDFREIRWIVIIYVSFFFAASGGMLGIASEAGNIWTVISVILFILMAIFAFVQRTITGK